MSTTSLTLLPFTTETLGKQTLGLRYATDGNECLFVMDVKASQSAEVGLHCPIRSEITAFPLCKLMKSTNTGQMHATSFNEHM